MSRVRNTMVWLALVALLFAVPVAQAQDVTPLIEVEGQAVQDGMVTIGRVVSDGPGWLVIHADDNGAPGDVVGYTAVEDGENTDVMVELDTELATDTLYAMLHRDLGTEGTFEFPGDDAPMTLDGAPVVETFIVTGLEDDAGAEDQDTAEDMVTPDVEISDQEIVDGAVTVDRVVSDGPGWIVIHADNNGTPGDVVGQAAVQDGENLDVRVEVDLDRVTDTMYAMLHTDVGTEGTYEFPGADSPVQVDGNTVMDPFSISMLAQPTPTTEADTDEEPETLPETGGTTLPWLPLVLVALGAAVVAGSALIMRRQAETTRVNRD